ncbi:MAG: type II secretion system F family protein [Nitrospiraceae bacterium]|nr:type II secretion system F family protein [Nitrospiraceae bacterium]
MSVYMVIALVFIGTASLVAFLLYLVVPKGTPIEERLRTLEPGSEPAVAYGEKPPGAFRKFLGRLGANIPLRVQDYGKYSRMLMAAGIRKEKLPVFMGAKLLLAVLLPAIYLVLYGFPVETDHLTRVLLVVVFGILGFLIPSYWLSKAVKKRQLQIFLDLPDVLDLMTVCVEAGLSMDAAMVAVCANPHMKESPLVAEMTTVLRETRAGKQRSEALRDMGERAMVDDLKAFTAMLIQTERLGTSLARALRIHSDSLRTIRMQRAEELAAKTSIKLLFPLVFFILPALFVVMLLPAVIRIFRVINAL